MKRDRRTSQESKISAALRRQDRSMAFLSHFGRILFWTAFIMGLSAAVVWPVLTLATKQRQIYNGLIGILVLGFLVFAIVRRLLVVKKRLRATVKQ